MEGNIAQYEQGKLAYPDAIVLATHRYLTVIQCPICLKLHTHGVGAIGHRQAHCGNFSLIKNREQRIAIEGRYEAAHGGYNIVDPDGMLDDAYWRLKGHVEAGDLTGERWGARLADLKRAVDRKRKLTMVSGSSAVESIAVEGNDGVDDGANEKGNAGEKGNTDGGNK